jgi:hypothetical protein
MAGVRIVAERPFGLIPDVFPAAHKASELSALSEAARQKLFRNLY